MNRKSLQIVVVMLVTSLFLGAGVVVAQVRGLQATAPLRASADDGSAGSAVIAQAQYTPASVITVTSGKDPDTSKSTTCASSPADECTLRRAIVESRGKSSSQLPVLIEFDIPQDAAEGYDSSLGIWEIEVRSTSDLSVFRRLKGEVIIDGSTQPGGRTNGPKINLVGPGTGQKDGFIVGDIAGDDEIMIIDLGMQNFKNHMTVNTDDNVIEDCWFGLSSDGATLSSGDDTDPEGGSGIALTAGAERNVIRDNKFAGFFGVAAAIRGDGNEFSGNRVGMRADGTVPLPGSFDQHPCSGGAWAGGSGISVDGDNHIIGGSGEADGNRFAGLYLDIFAESEQPFAIDLVGSGEDILIQNNVIGLDVSDNAIGICGRGIKLDGGPEGTQVIDNTIVEPGLSAILMNHWTLNGNTLRGNVIRREDAWPGAQGDNAAGEGAIAYGATVPDELSSFQPAVITQIDGVTVSGVSGTSQSGESCDLCTIEVFRDDTDTVVEALQSLAVVTAGANGNWSATLSAPLAEGQGLRTMSTVPDDWTISGLDGGTTSNLSELFSGGQKVYLPLVARGL